MSVLIKDMEMPKEPTLYVFMLHPDGKMDGLPCKAVPVPPHGRLVDADALKGLFYELIGHIAKRKEIEPVLEHMVRVSAVVIKMIDDAPTIIEAEEADQRVQLPEEE